MPRANTVIDSSRTRHYSRNTNGHLLDNNALVILQCKSHSQRTCCYDRATDRSNFRATACAANGADTDIDTMPVPSVSFLVGLVVLGYLFTFIVFAVLRVITGISIQRVGYSGFRRIALSPSPGIKITIRGVGLSPHRPTFALPTWCSLVVTELCITVDLKALEDGKRSRNEGYKHANGSARKANGSVDGPAEEKDSDEGHGKLWRKLTELKEKIKRLHGKIQWLRLVDLIADAAEVNIVGVGSLRVERATLCVDTRSQTVDR